MLQVFAICTAQNETQLHCEKMNPSKGAVLAETKYNTRYRQENIQTRKICTYHGFRGSRGGSVKEELLVDQMHGNVWRKQEETGMSKRECI